MGYLKGGRLIRLYSDRRITRLGASLKTTGRIKDERMRESLDCLRDFREKALGLGAERIVAVGTQALREAENSKDFLERAKDEAGIEIRVISPEEEALLTVEGVSLGLEIPEGKTVIFDLGGGSTEFIITDNAPHGEGIEITSIPIGVLKLSQIVGSSPPLEKSILDARAVIIEALNSIKRERVKGTDKRTVIGTGGTVTCLAAIDLGLSRYEPERIHGHRLTLGALMDMFRRLSSMSLEEISHTKGMEKGREDIILPGLLYIIEILEHFSSEELIVSDYGILEGIIKVVGSEVTVGGEVTVRRT